MRFRERLEYISRSNIYLYGVIKLLYNSVLYVKYKGG